MFTDVAFEKNQINKLKIDQEPVTLTKSLSNSAIS